MVKVLGQTTSAYKHGREEYHIDTKSEKSYEQTKATTSNEQQKDVDHENDTDDEPSRPDSSAAEMDKPQLDIQRDFEVCNINLIVCCYLYNEL